MTRKAKLEQPAAKDEDLNRLPLYLDLLDAIVWVRERSVASVLAARTRPLSFASDPLYGRSTPSGMRGGELLDRLARGKIPAYQYQYRGVGAREDPAKFVGCGISSFGRNTYVLPTSSLTNQFRKLHSRLPPVSDADLALWAESYRQQLGREPDWQRQAWKDAAHHFTSIGQSVTRARVKEFSTRGQGRPPTK